MTATSPPNNENDQALSSPSTGEDYGCGPSKSVDQCRVGFGVYFVDIYLCGEESKREGPLHIVEE